MRVERLERGPWRTVECRYEHEPQIPLRLVLLPATSRRQQEVRMMKQIRDRVAGLDVHRDAVVACCQLRDPDGSVED